MIDAVFVADTVKTMTPVAKFVFVTVIVGLPPVEVRMVDAEEGVSRICILAVQPVRLTAVSDASLYVTVRLNVDP